MVRSTKPHGQIQPTKRVGRVANSQKNRLATTQFSVVSLSTRNKSDFGEFVNKMYNKQMPE